MKACLGKVSAISAIVIVAATACASGTVINTGDTAPQLPAGTTAPPPQFGTANLVNAADYALDVNGRKGYYFSTPSGRWRCAILPRDRAGCQPADRTSAMGVTGAPDEVPDPEGGTAAPNALVLDQDTDAHFAALTQPEFSQSAAVALPFGKALAVAGFRCNVQEQSGVSCVRELTGRGFTFSAEGYTLHYTDVP
ncbi:MULTISPECIES: hypothetical protein [unclassified Mycolicibacterium]|uniref:hypothetical protein n=1 Tax=unclassified Mycolicibacterium TaxID=2636767 RepID=UPI00130BAC5E|nr:MULTISPECIES: hypothetical protein [unclassified Mycolicibacterium]MUL85486.1 hypothetical protein [Mycolicibacterium sp. CBMA 329]MUL88750.1 hypothetical protein [Mycolicibacterium sp. CBMA 331]MUM01956.1 hypothetical protein [Mycolicibacterium sp. CBMA 334]MUM29227.1 hypothetical protein [Mycolicibacterium sp. CBMA 295]MUM40397.1 hypothetical protein [Mycolicibacterium sp. CBMA 247]